MHPGLLNMNARLDKLENQAFQHRMTAPDVFVNGPLEAPGVRSAQFQQDLSARRDLPAMRPCSEMRGPRQGGRRADCRDGLNDLSPATR
jgi:hypothetical protein